MTDSEEKGWQKRLYSACIIDAHTQEEDEKHFREVAEAAPLEELELFLEKPGTSHTESARSVMRQVFRHRAEEIRNQKASDAARSEWWWGLVQQTWAQTNAGILLALLTGFVTGWFVFSR